MKIRLLSDLHIEHHSFQIPALPDDQETVLVLAGDIGVVADMYPLDTFLRRACSMFRAVVMVGGNHEFYHGTWPDSMEYLRSLDWPSNLHILEQSTVQIEHLTFVGATLWSDFEDGNFQSMMDAKRFIRDFSCISEAGAIGGARVLNRLTPQTILTHHRIVRKWLEKTLSDLRDAQRKTVLVTHHGVTPMSIHEMYRDDPANGCFVSDLSSILNRTRPAFAFHGHTHSSFRYFVDGEGSTEVIANPRGYPRRLTSQENLDFDPHLTIEA